MQEEPYVHVTRPMRRLRASFPSLEMQEKEASFSLIKGRNSLTS